MSPSTIEMTGQEMAEVLKWVRADDRLRLVFVDQPVEQSHLEQFLAMCDPNSIQRVLYMDELSFWTLRAVGENGKWNGLRSYEVTVRQGFDPANFIHQTQRYGLLESITRAVG